MILTRTPLRISIGGGGTDLPSYYRRHGGSVLSAAIDKYVYLAVNATFTDDYLLKYSVHERVTRVEDIEHALIREVLQRYRIRPGIEIVSVADIPAGTGLGSSGSFTVGLLRALHAHRIEQCSIAARSPRRPATSRSSGSPIRSASRTSTSRRSAGSPGSSSTPTTRSTSTAST